MENSSIILIILVVVGFIFKDQILEFISKSGLTGCPNLAGDWDMSGDLDGVSASGVVRMTKEEGTKQTYIYSEANNPSSSYRLKLVLRDDCIHLDLTADGFEPGPFAKILDRNTIVEVSGDATTHAWIMRRKV